MKRRKKIRYLPVFGLILCIICGCGQKEYSIEEAGNRTVITIEGAMSGEVEQCITLFNQTNSDYYVQKIEYEGLTHEEFLDARALRIMTGRSADILVLSGDYRLAQYIEKSALEDLSPYIERDLKRKEFVDGALDLFAAGQGVWALPVEADTRGILKKCENQNKYEEITFSKLCEWVKQVKPASLIEYPAEQTLWNLYWYFELDIDNPDELSTAIEMARKYERRSENGSEMGKDFLMLECNMGNPRVMLAYYDTYGKLGEDISIVNDPYLLSTSFGINSSSGEKEGAWEFICFLLREECQEIIGNSYTPVRKDAFMNKCEKYFSDKIQSQYSVEKGVSLDDFLQNYNDMLKRGRPRELLGDNYDIWRILWEEAQMYYNGDRSLEDTVGMIQNRVRLYREENP